MTEAPEPLWKRKARRGVFEGDVAVVELRSRLALAPERILEPAAPNSTVSTFARLLRLTGGVLMAVAVAAVTGYLGLRLWTKSPQVAPASGQADVVPTVPPAEIGVAPVDARGATHEATPADGVQQPLPLATAPGSGPPSPSPPPAPAEDASEIATKMKANEDIFRQFMLWRDQQQRKQ